MKCAAHHPRRTAPDATGHVRYVVGNREIVSGPICDRCQADECTTLRPAEQRGEIKELGAVPLDYREQRSPVADLMTREQRIAERTRDLLAEIVSVELSHDLDPYPASVGEVADEIARYILELDDAGTARGLADKVMRSLRRGLDEDHTEQDAAQVLATLGDPADAHRNGQDCGRLLCTACGRPCADLT